MTDMTDITLEQRADRLFDAMMAAPYGNACIGDVVCAETTASRLRAAWLPLIEAALRLSAGADSARLDALEALVDSQPDKALLLHHGQHGINGRYAGLGLSNTRRTLRDAIDQAAPRHEPGEASP